jgi:hypothetical protein
MSARKLPKASVDKMGCWLDVWVELEPSSLLPRNLLCLGFVCRERSLRVYWWLD